MLTAEQSVETDTSPAPDVNNPHSTARDFDRYYSVVIVGIVLARSLWYSV
jgi:hypothetical protein